MLPSKDAINYCTKKDHNFLSEKLDNSSNNNNKYVKIAFRTYNNSMITINYKTEKCINNLCVNIHIYDVYKLILNCNNFTLEQLVKVLRFDTINVFQK